MDACLVILEEFDGGSGSTDESLKGLNVSAGSQEDAALGISSSLLAVDGEHVGGLLMMTEVGDETEAAAIGLGDGFCDAHGDVLPLERDTAGKVIAVGILRIVRHGDNVGDMGLDGCGRCKAICCHLTQPEAWQLLIFGKFDTERHNLAALCVTHAGDVERHGEGLPSTDRADARLHGVFVGVGNLLGIECARTVEIAVGLAVGEHDSLGLTPYDDVADGGGSITGCTHIEQEVGVMHLIEGIGRDGGLCIPDDSCQIVAVGKQCTAGALHIRGQTHCDERGVVKSSCGQGVVGSGGQLEVYGLKSRCLLADGSQVGLIDASNHGKVGKGTLVGTQSL